MPGHEIVGRVSAAGDDAGGHKDGIDTVYERMLRSHVKYRFVIDIASMGA